MSIAHTAGFAFEGVWEGRGEEITPVFLNCDYLSTESPHSFTWAPKECLWDRMT